MLTVIPGVTAALDLFDNVSAAAVRAGLISRRDVRTISGALTDHPVSTRMHARLNESVLLRLWTLLALRHGGSDVGAVLALQVPVGTLGLLGEVVSRAASPTEAFDQVARFSRLLNQRARIGQTRTAGHLNLLYEGALQIGRDQPGLEAGIIWSLAHLALLPGRLFGTAIQPVQAMLPGSPPQDMSTLHAIFGPSIGFKAGQPGIRFALAALRGLHKVPETCLLSHLEGAAAQYVAALPPCNPLCDRVRAILDADLEGGPPPLATVARQIGISQRSLQRTLKAQGTSFARILDDVRRERARALLAEGRQSLGAITYRLGYADQAVLSRAARRWFGAPPRRLR